MPSSRDHDSTPVRRGREARAASGATSKNPLALPYPWWYELLQRLKLFAWWVNYKMGVGREAALEERIIRLASELGLEERWARRVVKHAVSEFSTKGLGPDYYGYHGIDHELEATYFTLLAAKGVAPRFSDDDLCYLFLAALFHDFDPLKEFDKPNEDAVEWFLRGDSTINRFIKDAGIDIDILMVLIHRTAFPFRGEIKERTEKRMHKLLTMAEIPEDDLKRRKHYTDLGWFLSVAERVAGYALGDFARAHELAALNAHAVGWHPSVINIESVKYFDMLEEEKEVVDLVLRGIPEEYIRRFEENVASFRSEWKKEIELRDLVLRNKRTLVSVIEEIRSNDGVGVAPDIEDALLRLCKMIPPPLRVSRNKFRESLSISDTLLVTLRVDSDNGAVVGYAKGGPLERYKLRRGTHDENMGRENTIYLEPMTVEAGYWGANGGHVLRKAFLEHAKKRGYRFVSAYAHRNVIEQRMSRGEPIKMVCRYDPDRMDYYRWDLVGIGEAYLDYSTGSPEESLAEEPDI